MLSVVGEGQGSEICCAAISRLDDAAITPIPQSSFLHLVHQQLILFMMRH